nr:iron-siderophore ABC transporter substrate-binding protein [Micromonospora sp. DSM 115978]
MTERSRRPLAVAASALALTMTLAGCGGGGSASTGDVETRDVVDGRGKTITIPVDPQRVVITEQTLDYAVLGFAPAGARNLIQDTSNYPEFADLLSDTEDLGTSDLDFEQVLSLEPDLIITYTGRLDEADHFEAIAPTVYQDLDTPDRKHRWDETLTFVGDLIGKRAEADKLLGDYQTRLGEFKASMGDRLDSTEVSVIRVSDDSMKIYTLGSFSGGVLRDAGLKRPANQNLDAFEMEERTNGEESEGFDLSPERLSEADGDVIFVVTSIPTDPTRWDEEDKLAHENAEALDENPLFRQLRAFQNDQVFHVGRHWNGESLVDANRMLDDLEKHLLSAE